MANVKRIFTGGINADDSIKLIKEDEYLNLQNGRVGITKHGRNLRIENIPGTTLIPNTLPAGTNTDIGTAVDFERRRLIYFNHNSNGDHAIYCYDVAANTIYTVLTNAQVTGGLLFNRDYRIDRNAKVVGDLLIWTDNLNEPRCINIEAAIKLNHAGYVTTVAPYTSPLAYTTLTHIKKPPIYRLSVSKTTDGAFANNYIRNGAYQFTYRYRYKYYQESALAAFSALIPYSVKADNSNVISGSIPVAEVIADEVQSIDIVVRYGNTGKSAIIKTWDKDNGNDNAAIVAHNAGVSLGFVFRDDIAGIALDDVSANTSFDDVALYAETLEIARNRVFFANILKGYTTPASTSLAGTVTSAGSPPGFMLKTGSSYKISIAFYDRYRRKCGIVRNDAIITIADRVFAQATFPYLIDWTLSNTNALAEIPDWAYYYQIHITKNLTKSFFMQGVFQNASYVKKDDDGLLDFTTTAFSDTETYALAVSLDVFTNLGMGYTFTEGDQAVIYSQSGTNYKTSVIGQSGKYVLLKPVDIGTITNSYKFTMIAETGSVANHDAPTMELENNYIEAGFSAKSTIAGNFPADDTSIFDFHDGVARTFTVTGSGTVKATATSASPFKIQLYTVHADGSSSFVDLATIAATTTNGAYYTYTINQSVTIATTARQVSVVFFSADAAMTWTIVSGKITFARGSDLNMIEIYTPYKPTQTEPYYEVGPVYNITNPTASNRVYATLSGSITGDVALLSRLVNVSTAYNAEAMSPNDDVWKIWQRDIGWPNFTDKIGQQRKPTSLQFSDTYINGTKTNGLNKFQPLNTEDIGGEAGSIQKLQLTNKQRQEDGTVMLIISVNMTNSMYLGEAQITASGENAFIAKTEGVIGSINALRNKWGTVNPESVVEYNGNVWWFDMHNGAWIQYSTNGLTSVSNYKMRRFFGRYAERYLEQGTDRIRTMNGYYHIPSCIDPFNGEVLCVLPATEDNAISSGNPVGFVTKLPSYPSLPSYASSLKSSFDIYDGDPKTLAFKYEKNQWNDSYGFAPEWMEYIENNLFGFKSGALYLHNDDTANYNRFYGVNYPLRLCFTVNIQPSAIKVVQNIALEASVAPDFTVVYADLPNEQITDLVAGEYVNKEGVLYAVVRRDRLSPNIAGAAEQKMLLGDDIKDAAPKIMLEFQQYAALMWIDFINVGVGVSKGHVAILQ